MRTHIRIRPERPGDAHRIKEINDNAFGQSKEGILVEKLRREPGYTRDLSLVALLEGKVVGHILFFPVNIINGENSAPSLSLAPMAVHPDYQHRGIGSHLVESGLEKAAEAGFQSVVVVGPPGFYSRFGFSPASSWNISAPLEIPGEEFMARELSPGALQEVSGEVSFSNVFNDAI
jgi:predicted N-acetyltransferase YhbS